MAVKNKFIHFNTRAGFDAKMPNPTDKTHDFYNYLIFIKDTKEIYTHGQFYASDMPYVIGTYSEIKQLANSGSLIPNQVYAITDYTYVVRSGYEGQFQSGNNVFAIILKAADPYSFHEDAKALPVGSYFNNCNLNAWEIKYSIHNDNTRHGWAASNGKGVIYYMKDEYGNEAGYDFKNVKFYRNYIDLSNYYNAINGSVVIDGATYSSLTSFQSKFGITFPTAMRYASYSTKRTGQEFYDMGLVSEDDVLNSSFVYAMYKTAGAFPGNVFVKTTGLASSYFYTFSYIPSVSNSWNTVYDATVYSGASSFAPRMNVIEPSFHKVPNSSSVYRLQMLYDNVFIMNGAISPWHSFNNTIKTGAQGNTIDSGCSFNVIGENSSYNIIGEHSQYNTIEKDSNDNILGKRCKYNNIGNNAFNNILWDDSTRNIMGPGSVKNFALKFSDGNIWDSNCDSCGIHLNYSANIIFRSGAKNAILRATSLISNTAVDHRLQNIDVQAGASFDIDFTDIHRNNVTVIGNSKGNITKSSSATIYPGEHTVITYSGSTINVTLGKAYSAMPFNTDEYSFEFTVGSTVPTLSITSGSTIIWANGDTPVLESGYKYEISVRNNLAVYAQYDV